MDVSVKSNRIRLIDTLRGITILGMIAFHTCWDLMYFGLGVTETMMDSSIAYIWQQSICWSFILISGYCFSIGHHQLKRGILSLGGGIIITIVTLLVVYDARDIFGVLYLLGTATLITIPINKVVSKCGKSVHITGLILSVLLFIITRNINRGYLGFEGFNLIKLPENLYHCGYFMTYLGFKQAGFFSTDYFSVFPWLFLFLTGYFLRYLLKESNFEDSIRSIGIAPLELLGRHSLLIYMLHQVVAYGLVYLIYYLVR